MVICEFSKELLTKTSEGQVKLSRGHTVLSAASPLIFVALVLERAVAKVDK